MTDTPRTAAGQDFVDPPTDIAYLTHTREQRLAIALAIEAEAEAEALPTVEALAAALQREVAEHGSLDTQRRLNRFHNAAARILAALKKSPK